jgi:hypothetical protein
MKVDDTAIHASFKQLLQVCAAFVATAEAGADIRDYGLTPELIAACTCALAAWDGQQMPTDAVFGESSSAAWRAYVRMLANYGEDFT